MSRQIQTLKGFRDFLPQAALARQWLTSRIRQVFEQWGYDPIETPTLEYLELFEGQIGEEEKLFYKFTDPGGRKVALRYDQTVPTCRVVGQNWQQLPMPFKRYQIQTAFRAEKPQKGRYREFLQCDADIFGVASPYADAEAIALSLEVFRSLGFKQAVALISDRALLSDIPYEAIVAIDKLKKIGEAGVIEEMKTKGVEETEAREYLEMVKNLKPNEAISVILDYLTKMGFDKSWYRFEPTIARSFAYSTGVIWEVEIPGFEGGSVLGGERYDKLVERVAGVAIPGTGFGLGFDRTLEALFELGLVPETVTAAKVLVTVFSQELLGVSLETAGKLRRLGINTEVYTDPGVSLEKQLKYADKKRVPFVVIVGPEEKEKKVVRVRRMETREERVVTSKLAASPFPRRGGAWGMNLATGAEGS